MKDYSKIFKWLMLGLIVVSFALLVIGFAVGFTTNGGVMTDVLLYWAYAMVGIALVAVVAFGLWIGIKNNPRMLVKLGIGAGVLVVICLLAYLLAPGKPALGMLTQPSAATLKLTDTILNLTYFAGICSIVAIIAGEVRLAAINKKK